MAFHLKSCWTNPKSNTKIYKTLCLLLRPCGTHWKESGYSLIIFNNHLEYLRTQCGYDILKITPKKWRIIGRLPYFLGIDQYEDYLCNWFDKKAVDFEVK